MLIYNVDFLLAGLIFLLVILRHFLLRPTLHLVNNKSFLWTIIVSITNIFFDILCTVLITRENPDLRVAAEISVTILYVLQILVPHAFMWHIQDLTGRADRNSLLTVANRYVMPVFMGAMIFLNHWTHVFFTVDHDGIYIRGPFYKGMYLFAGVYVFFIIYYAFSRKSNISRSRKRAIAELFIYSSIAVGLQFFFPDTLLSGFGVALGITVLFFTINNPFNHADSLTESFDIRYLEEVYQSVHQRKTNMYIVSVTLSQMKRLNLVIGMQKGNKILKNVASIFKNSDKRVSVFRSGRRFVIACPTLTTLYKTAELASETFRKDLVVDDEKIKVPAIICVIDDLEKIESSDQLLAYIEFMTNTGSKTETNVIISSDELFKRFTYYQEVESYLDEAIQNDLFSINYQPIWNTKEGRYTSVECLSRLKHPTLGNVPPYIFIQLAERNDQINKISILQMRRICSFVKAHPFLLDTVDSFKINLSPAELMREGHIEKLMNTIEYFGLPSTFFQFEITETVATEYGEALDEIISSIRSKGIGLCLDDFGSGFANLNTVMKLPFKSVKLDRTMLFGIADDERIRALYSSVVSSLHMMNFSIVAEGVETEMEKDFVTDMGVDLIQGYYYSKPVDEEKLISTLSH